MTNKFVIYAEKGVDHKISPEALVDALKSMQGITLGRGPEGRSSTRLFFNADDQALDGVRRLIEQTEWKIGRVPKFEISNSRLSR